MSVLKPVAQIGDARSGRFWFPLLLGLVVGLATGGGTGYLLGRGQIVDPAPPVPSTTTPNKAPAPDAGIPQAAIDGQTSAPVAAGGDPLAIPADLPGGSDAVRHIDVTISGSLYATLAAQFPGREADILNAQLGRVLLWWMDLRRDVLPGDRLQALYEPVPGPGELRLLHIRYTSEKRNLNFQATYFHPRGTRYGRYYDAQGQEVEGRLVDGPIQEYEQITELMNNTGRRHSGVDFKTDVGTPITVPFRSRILRRNWQLRGNGKCLELLYIPTGHTVKFLHLDEIMPAAKVGAVVEPGTLVAKSGNTGRSTAPHLHYEMRDASGKLVNPFKAHQTQHTSLIGEELKAFEELRRKLDQWLGDSGANP